MSNRTTNLPGFLTFIFTVTTSGTPEQLTKKITGTGIAFVEGGEGVKDTITDSGSDFLNTGFQPGDTITVSGSSDNDGTYSVYSVVAGTITLTSQGDLTAEGAGDSVKIVAPVDVPDGVGLRIKALKGNTLDVHLANNATSANHDSDPQGGWVLDASESIELQVSRSDAVWVDVEANGEGVEVALEQGIRTV